MKEAPIDVILLCFHALQSYHLADIRRMDVLQNGDVGNSTPPRRHKSCVCDLDCYCYAKNICKPQEIVNRIKQMTTESAQEVTTNEAGGQLSQSNVTAVDDLPIEECSGP